MLLCRLSGAALVVSFVNYWWPCFPSNLAQESLARLAPSDQWTFRVAHYAPWLLYWWMTQKWFPSLSILSGNTSIFTHKDLEILKRLSEAPSDGQVVILLKHLRFIFWLLNNEGKIISLGIKTWKRKYGEIHII